MSTIIDQHIFDELTAQAKASPRLRMNLDLRNSPSDGSQRMLNAIEPGAVMPILRQMKSPESEECQWGHLHEVFYIDDVSLWLASVVLFAVRIVKLEKRKRIHDSGRFTPVVVNKQLSFTVSGND